MSIRDSLANDIQLLGELAPLISAKQEIAVIRIAQVRDRVTAQRTYQEGLTKVLSEVRAAYQEEIAKKMTEQKHGQATVLLSTNTRLSGPIISDTIQAFLQHIDATPSDVYVIGQVGKEQLQQRRPDLAYLFIDIKQDRFTAETAKPLIERLLRYQQVTFIYGRFVSLIQQRAESFTLGEGSQDASGELTPYLFEPALPDVIDHFNSEIFTTVVRQTFGESELAILGSRITAMEQASHKIQKELAQARVQAQMARRRQQNKKQRERLAGMRLWHTE